MNDFSHYKEPPVLRWSKDGEPLRPLYTEEEIAWLKKHGETVEAMLNAAGKYLDEEVRKTTEEP